MTFTDGLPKPTDRKEKKRRKLLKLLGARNSTCLAIIVSVHADEQSYGRMTKLSRLFAANNLIG